MCMINTPTSSHPPDHRSSPWNSQKKKKKKKKAAIWILQILISQELVMPPRGPYTSLLKLNMATSDWVPSNLKRDTSQDTQVTSAFTWMQEGANLAKLNVNILDTWSVKSNSVEMQRKHKNKSHCVRAPSDAFTSIGYYPISHNGCLIWLNDKSTLRGLQH